MVAFLEETEATGEIDRIVVALRTWFGSEDRAVIGLSGGLDSDVVARIAAHALGRDRLKVFTVIQDNMEGRHLANARNLAGDLGVRLAELDLKGFPERFVTAMANADPEERFLPNGLLDPARTKCALRTVAFSAYQDRGYVVVGTSNRTELETGFFLPFGDGIWHVGPIVHLYKTEVFRLASSLGTRPEVVEQPPSAGFWEGQEDLEDLSYWLLNAGPIGRQRDFTDEDDAAVREIRSVLTIQTVDRALAVFSHGGDDRAAATESGLPLSVTLRLAELVRRAKPLKQRPFGLRMLNRA
jgi:NAD+ synthase